MLYSNSQTSLYCCIVGCRWHVIFATWIPGSITFHHAPIHYKTIRTQHARVQYSLNPPRIWTYNLLQTDCKITALVIPIIPLSTAVPRRRTPEKRVFLYSVLQSRQYVSNSTQLVPALLILLLRERMSRLSTQCTRYATKIKDESSEIRRKISEMAKNNHNTVGFKGLTHSISYNVITTKYNTIRKQHDVRDMQPKLKMNHQK